MSNILKMLMGGKPVAEDPEAIDFDGTNDYLSRASDFTGNTDSKTFTFSCWVYKFQTAGHIYLTGTLNNFLIYTTNNRISILAKNAGGTYILNAETATYTIPLNTWSNILISIDMANVSNRAFYLNDVAQSVTWSTYTNDTIDFTQTQHQIIPTAEYLKGRLAHVFLDYTYRDLSVEANRRLFITDDLKRAKPNPLIALSPIMYMQLTDPDTAHVNSGTGGDMTLNGTVALSGRGPGQDNCVASEFGSATEFLSLAPGTGTANKVLTFAVSFTITEIIDINSVYIFAVSNAGTNPTMHVRILDNNRLEIRVTKDPDQELLKISISNFAIVGKLNHISLSIDLGNYSNSYMSIDGVSYDISALSSVNDNISWDTAILYRIMNSPTGTNSHNCRIGELYFDTTYTDLSTDNPFWDSDLNRPKPVRQVLEETGNTPLIAMPIEASNAGLNLGTGGNFTLNGGGLTGARGASEFWARSAKFDGSTGYLSRSSLTGLTDSDTVTFVMAIKQVYTAGEYYFNIAQSNGGFADDILMFFSDTFTILNSAGSQRYSVTSLGLTNNNYNIILLSVNLSGSVDEVYVNGVSKSGSFNNSGTFPFSEITDAGIGARVTTNSGTGGGVTNPFDGSVGFMYFTTDYIDFSSEANRLLFVDALGYPIDLTDSIADGDIPEPLIYMKFDDTTDLGANSGTGGDFTVNGTVTAGSDVDPNA